LTQKGAHVTPGIIDCHSHTAISKGVNESSHAVTAEVRIADVIDATDIDLYRQLGGGVTAANILHGSANPIGGQNQVIKFRWGSLPEELKLADAAPGVKFALGENVKQSNRGRRSTRYPQTRMGVEQLIRDRFRAAQEYDAAMKKRDGLPPRRDLQLEALSEIVSNKRLIHCHSTASMRSTRSLK
jgi:N-acetylglucosamine-6-phosphate deacetylase